MNELLKQLTDINEDLEDDSFEVVSAEALPLKDVICDVRNADKEMGWNFSQGDVFRFNKLVELITSTSKIKFLYPNVSDAITMHISNKEQAIEYLNQNLNPNSDMSIIIEYRNPMPLGNQCYFFLYFIIGTLVFGWDKGSKYHPIDPRDPDLKEVLNILNSFKLPNVNFVFETLGGFNVDEDFDDAFDTVEPYIPLVEVIYENPAPNIVGWEIKNSNGKKGTIEQQSSSQLWIKWEGNKHLSKLFLSYPDKVRNYMIKTRTVNEDTEDTSDMFDATELPDENAGKEGSSEYMAKVKKLLEDKGWEVYYMTTLYPKRDCVEWYDIGQTLFTLGRGNILFHFYVSGNGLYITLPNGEDDVSDMKDLLRYGVYDDETFAAFCDDLYKEVEGPFDESDVNIDFWMETEDTEKDLGSSYDYDFESHSSISGLLEDITDDDYYLQEIDNLIKSFNDDEDENMDEALSSDFDVAKPKYEFNKYGIEISDPKTKKKLMGCTNVDISNVNKEYPLRIFASMSNVIIYIDKNKDLWSNASSARITDLEGVADILGFSTWEDFVSTCLRVDEDLDTNEECFDVSNTNAALMYVLDCGHIIPQEIKQRMIDNYPEWDETPINVKWTVVKDSPVLHTEEAGALSAPIGKFDDNDYIIYYGDNYSDFECEYIWNDYARDMIGSDTYDKELREDVEDDAFETNDRSIDLDDLTDEQKEYIINNFIKDGDRGVYGAYILNTRIPWRIKPYAAARNGFDYTIIVKGIIPIVPIILSEDQLHELVSAVGNVNVSEELEDGFEISDWVIPGRVLSKDEVGSDYGYYELSSEQCYILDARTSGGSHDLPDDTWGEMFRRGNDIWVDLFSLSSPEEFIGTLDGITDEDLAAIHVNKEEIPDLVLEEDFEPFSDDDIDVKRVGQSKLSLYIKGKLVSWVYVSNTGYIYYLETKKEYRGLGLGTILIKQAIAEMGGYWLHIERPNIKVQRWYENLGFIFYNPDDKYVRLMVKEDRIADFEELVKKCNGNLRKMLGNLADKVIVDLNDYENKPEVRTVYDDEGNILKEMIKEDFMDDMDILEPSNTPDILKICSTDPMFHTKGGIVVSLNPEKVRGAVIEVLKLKRYFQYTDEEDLVNKIDKCVCMLDDTNSSTGGNDVLTFSSESSSTILPRDLTIKFFDMIKIDPAGFFHGDWFERIRNGEDGEDILAEKYPDVVLRYKDRFNDTVNDQASDQASDQVNESKEDRARFSKWANDPKLEKDFYDNQQRLTDKDIYSWMKKTPADLRQAIDDLDDTNAEKRAEAMKGATLVTRGDYWTIYRIDTVEASKLLGKGTRWCISGTGSMEIELPVYASSKARAMVSIRKAFPKAEITSVTADDDDGMYLVGIKTTQGDFYFNDYKENEEATYYFLISTPANKECYGDIKMNKVAIKITSFNDINIYNSQDTEITVDDIPHNDDLFDYQILK